MSEETEPAASQAGDPFAISLALAGASRERADTFLEEQTRLARLQSEELSHELGLRHWSLWVRHLSGLLKLTLEVGLAVIAVGLAGFIAAGLWNAAHSDGLVIESFSVPPELAQRGLTGQVVAGGILDHLTEINKASISSRTAKSYAASWGDEIKVEIPDTGISVAEVYRFLRRWLGHESHITGAVWRAQNGIVITARTDEGSITVTGPEADMDGQIRKAAEALFGLAEPYRYAIYLSTHGREAEGMTVFRHLIANGSPDERAWGYVGLARFLTQNGEIGPREQARLNREAVMLDPENRNAVNNLAVAENAEGHWEASLADFRKEKEMLASGDTGLSAVRLPVGRQMTQNQVEVELGAYSDAIPSVENIIRSGTGGSYADLSSNLALSEIRVHDLKAARRLALDPERERASADFLAYRKIILNEETAAAEENWPAVVAVASSVEPLQKRHPTLQERSLIDIAPLEAYAEAKLGDFPAAEKLIATTPADCDACMLERARIAELAGQHGRADWWFARVAADAPSIPLVFSAWGEVLLRRGDADGAIGKFKLANDKGPHFADPLEGWGEALMAKSQSHLALAKFEEAEKYAPNWGRLHLKWGEALVYAGRQAEAKAQLARAAQLDLTPSEKSELAKARLHG